MALCVHYQAARRNPYRLLELCGFDGQPKTASGGRAFLQKLKTLPSCALRPLLLLAGGFLDGMTGCAHAILEHLPSPLFDECDAYYREHDENEDMLDIVHIYGAAGKTMVLAGHSWGASSMTLDVAAKTSMPVELLVTLDPLDWRKPPPYPSGFHPPLVERIRGLWLGGLVTFQSYRPLWGAMAISESRRSQSNIFRRSQRGAPYVPGLRPGRGAGDTAVLRPGTGLSARQA